MHKIGKPLFWIELFIDSFGACTTRNRSVTGVYVSFSNIQRRFKHCQRNVNTLMLVPHVSLCSAIERLRADLIKLQKGVFFNEYEEEKVNKILVKGLISCVVSDHPQACDISRHLGVNANQNCRLCWTNKAERAKFSSIILDHSQTRRRQQTDIIVSNMRESLSSKFSQTKQNQLQKECGIRIIDCPSQGVDFEPHIQCFSDIDHLIDLGLMEDLFEYINSLMGTKGVSVIQTRY